MFKILYKNKKSLSNIILNVLYVITRIHIHLNHVCELDAHRKLFITNALRIIPTMFGSIGPVISEEMFEEFRDEYV